MANIKYSGLPSGVTPQLTDITAYSQNPGSYQVTNQQLANLFLSYNVLNHAGNPNGNLAGTSYQSCWDITDGKLYICTTSGTSTSAIWTGVGGFSATGTGIITQTAANTYAFLTLTGTTNQINIINPQGLAGNPTFSFPNTGIVVSNILDTNSQKIVQFNTSANAVNYLMMNDAPTTDGTDSIIGAPILSVGGSDANITLGVQFKGLGSFSIFGNGTSPGILQLTEVTSTFGFTMSANNAMGTSYGITIPASQGASGTAWVNNGSGTLSNTAILPLGGGTMTGALILNADPTAALGAATKEYVDNKASGFTSFAPCLAASPVAYTATYSNGTAGVGATLTNATTQAAFAIDGIAGVLNSRYMIPNQASAFQNGPYTLTTVGSGSSNWVLTRATDFNSSATMVQNALFAITSGNTLSGSSLIQAAPGPFTVGTTNLVFNTFLSGGNAYVAGVGLTLTGNSFSITNEITAAGPITYPTITYNAQGQLTAVTAGITPLLPANNLSDLNNFGTARSNLGAQQSNAGLLALATLAASGTGIIYQTGVNTYAQRTLTGAANQISVSNSGGLTGNVVFSLPSSIQGILQFIDPNGIAMLGFNYQGSAVNYLGILNAPSSDAPLLTANGTDNNISITLQPKGTGAVQIEGNPSSSPGILRLFTNSVNYAQMQGVTGNTTNTNITWPATNPTVGQVITATSTGGATSWQTPSGGGGSGRLLNVRYLTVIGTSSYMPTSGTTNILVQAVGAGGSGGIDSTGTLITSGGGAGAFVQKFITGINSSTYTATYTIGLGGSASGSGNNGTATTYSDGSFTLTANGGNKGLVAASTLVNVNVLGGTGGSASGGDLNYKGGNGGVIFAYGGALVPASGSSGGDSFLCGGGDPSAGPNTGAAGGGNTPGSSGIIIIYEYS